MKRKVKQIFVNKFLCTNKLCYKEDINERLFVIKKWEKNSFLTKNDLK